MWGPSSSTRVDGSWDSDKRHRTVWKPSDRSLLSDRVETVGLLGIWTIRHYLAIMDLQTLIVAIIVGVAAAFVVRTFMRQFTSRNQKGCASCSHGGPELTGLTAQTGQARLARLAGASRDNELIQVEPIQVEESIRE